MKTKRPTLGIIIGAWVLACTLAAPVFCREVGTLRPDATKQTWGSAGTDKQQDAYILGSIHFHSADARAKFVALTHHCGKRKA